MPEIRRAADTTAVQNELRTARYERLPRVNQSHSPTAFAAAAARCNLGQPEPNEAGIPSLLVPLHTSLSVLLGCMQLFHLVALLATLATLVQAGSVSIPLRRRHSGRVKGGVLSYDSLQAELTKTRVKYGLQHTQDRRRAGLGSVPLHVEEDFAGEDRRRAVSSINLQEETGDASYYAPMTIGGSSYNIVLDTGSSVSLSLQHMSRWSSPRCSLPRQLATCAVYEFGAV